MMVVDNAFEIGQTVYLKTDPDQMARLITAFTVRRKGVAAYEVSFVGYTSWHDEDEISAERDALKAMA